MSPADIQLIWNALVGLGAGFAVAAAIGAVLSQSFLSGYLDANVRSLATKEDLQQVLEQLKEARRSKPKFSRSTGCAGTLGER